ncbi:MAG: hypothetical protein IT292_01765 [Deltaproteobacteria bacterium]|nr:hypothetical protein [Deltaproteobacteria bacterium]
MSKSDKLEKLLKVQESKETQVVLDGKKVQDVLRERQKAVDLLLKAKEDLLNRIEYYDQSVQQEGLITGDVSLLKGVSEQKKRLKQDLECLEQEIKNKMEELERARKYEQLNREELLAARQEKQKIAIVLNRAHEVALGTDAAREEVLVDELSGRKRN